MSRAKYLLLFVAALLLGGALLVRSLLSVPQYQQRAAITPAYSTTLGADAEWISLFNGENLEGWIPKIVGYGAGVNFAQTYRVEDGAISVNYDAYTEFDNSYGNLFYQTPYSHYVLRLQYRFLGEQFSDSPLLFWAWRNSGVMVHSQSPQSMGPEQWFPASIEVQLLGAAEGQQRSTANLCTPATNVVLYAGEGLYMPHCTNSLSASYAGDQWVNLEVEVWGAEKIRHFVNGQLVMEYSAPQLDPTEDDAKTLLAQRPNEDLLLSEGYIALQSESHPVQFRHIELHPITP